MRTITVSDEKQIEADKMAASDMQSENKAKAQSAFNQLWKRYKEPIFFYIFKMVGGDKELALDLRQDTFSKIFENIKQYDGSTALTTWMYTIARNTVIDYKRYHKVGVLSIESLVGENEDEDNAHNFSFQIADKAESVHETMVRDERAAALMKAIKSVLSYNGNSERMKESAEATTKIVMLYLGQHSLKEIADEVGLNLETTKTKLYRALDSLKVYLSAEARDFNYGRIRTTETKFNESEEEAEEVEEL